MDAYKINFVSNLAVYEDNQGAIQVATIPRANPTSKHLAVKYHWFRERTLIEFEIDKIESLKKVELSQSKFRENDL